MLYVRYVICDRPLLNAKFLFSGIFDRIINHLVNVIEFYQNDTYTNAVYFWQQNIGENLSDLVYITP